MVTHWITKRLRKVLASIIDIHPLLSDIFQMAPSMESFSATHAFMDGNQLVDSLASHQQNPNFYSLLSIPIYIRM